MSKVIFHYEDQLSYEMLVRCFDDYKKSSNYSQRGVSSISVYINPVTQYTTYLRRNKSGSVTGKCWSSKESK